MSKSLFIKIFLGLVALAFMFGVVLPALFSAKSYIALFLGLVLVLGGLAISVWNLLSYFDIRK